MTFETSKEIALHMLCGHETGRNFGTTIFRCTLCDETYSTIGDYRKHMREHERPAKCDVCKLPRFTDELDTHLCGDQYQIQCEYCDKSFTITTQLIEHLECHENQKFYHCKECHSYFGMKVLRDYHQEYHTRQSKNHTCETCSKSFASKNNLISHMKTHTTEKSKCSHNVHPVACWERLVYEKSRITNNK